MQEPKVWRNIESIAVSRRVRPGRLPGLGRLDPFKAEPDLAATREAAQLWGANTA